MLALNGFVSSNQILAAILFDRQYWTPAGPDYNAQLRRWYKHGAVCAPSFRVRRSLLILLLVDRSDVFDVYELRETVRERE